MAFRKVPSWLLNKKDSADFISALLNPPEPNEALKAAKFRYKLRAGTARAPAERPAAVFTPSEQQAAFFNEVQSGGGNIILRAVAGAGKTTTLIQALKFMTGRVFFGAYNKKIAEEIQSKADEAGVMRQGIWISTMHSAGFRAFRNYLTPEQNKRLEVTDKKLGNIIEAMAMRCAPDKKVLFERCAGFITKMVGFGKQYLIGVDSDLENPRKWMELVEHFAAEQELPDEISVETALVWVIMAYKKSIEQCSFRIDFDDMIFAPLYFKARFDTYDWLLGDEWQDANPARREMARRMLKPSGRALFCGDERQAIYGWTGASSDSLELTRQMFDCQTLPLTVTYRCAKAIVRHAHQWVDHIEAHENAPEGIVRPYIKNPAVKPDGLQEAPWFAHEIPAAEDAILCRYTRPLIQTAYGLLRAGIACKVEGRDIGNGLCKLAQRWRIRTIAALKTRLVEYQENEIRKAQIKKDEKRENEVLDIVMTLGIFIERCEAKGWTTIDELVVEIQSLFADNVTGVTTLSTGHKAKGREWHRVYWIEAAQRREPSREWQAVEEANIKYVITTRAKQELVLVPEPL